MWISELITQIFSDDLLVKDYSYSYLVYFQKGSFIKGIKRLRHLSKEWPAFSNISQTHHLQPREKQLQATPRPKCLPIQFYIIIFFFLMASYDNVQPQYLQHPAYLDSLHWWRSELGSEDSIPESAGHSKAVLVVHEMVLEVVFFQFSPVRRQCAVV